MYEAGLARPLVKKADFNGKAAYKRQRDLPHQAAMLCTLTMTENTDAAGVARFPVGEWPILDPETHAVLVDKYDRRSYTTSVAFCPSLGVNVLMAYLPHTYAKRSGIVFGVLRRTLSGAGGSRGLWRIVGPQKRAPKNVNEAYITMLPFEANGE